jgi:hypothetical protein
MESKLCNIGKMRKNSPKNILAFIEAPKEVKSIKEFEELVYDDKKLTFIELNYFIEFNKIAESILNDRIKGDVVNIGIYKGGGSLYMKSVFEELNMNEREWWLFDSFKGFNNETITETREQETLYWFEQFLNNSTQPNASEIYQLFKNFNLENKLNIIEGFIETTYKNYPHNNPICLLHIDVDFGQSTYFSLRHFYPNLVQGGWVVIDDYYLNLTFCKEMVDKFIHESGEIIEPIKLGNYQMGWRKNN